MGSYLVFSAYQFLLCGLRVMCFPNLIISDPDFHLHVGGLLNPIPGKLFSILPVLCSILFEELLCAQKLTGGYLCIWRECCTRKCTLTSTQLYMKWKDVNTQTRINLNKWRKAHLSCSFLPVFLPLFLCLVIVLCSNPLSSLQFHLKSFPSLNKILHLSLCLSCSSSLPTLFPLYLLLFLLLPWPLCHLSSLLPYSFFLFPFFLPLLHIFSASPQTVSLKSVDGMGLFAPVRWMRKREWNLAMLWTVSGPSGLLHSPRSVQGTLLVIRHVLLLSYPSTHVYSYFKIATIKCLVYVSV